MGETSSYEPSSYWSGHDFSKARKSYDDHAGRSYDNAKHNGKTAKSVIPDSIETKSKRPFVFVYDVTGTMGSWPSVIVSKMPYLEHQLKNEYLGEDMEIAFMAVGDMHGDDYPLQVRPFAKAADIKKQMDELIIEGGGIGNGTESYHLAALYMLKNVKIPKDAKPIAVFVGDERLEDRATKSGVSNFKISISETVDTVEIFRQLKAQGWAIYFVEKIPTDSANSDAQVYESWENAVGDDHIAELHEPDRIVDVIFGILGKETEKEDYFDEEIRRRQTPKQVETVYTALKSIIRQSGLKKLPGAVVPKLSTGGKKATPLLTKKS